MASWSPAVRATPGDAFLDNLMWHNAYPLQKQGAPPRTRGSTVWARYLVDGAAGSPAHAGIDPQTPYGRASRCRLPRARGDRPDYEATLESTQVAPPRTRGSTPMATRAPSTAAGSPAHAGIDPEAPPENPGGTRLPRARGDRPLLEQPPHVGVRAPPRTRGSTPGRRHDCRLRGGSPAHAGIDLGISTCRSAPARLPRARGDRPGPGNIGGIVCEAPPRTRGSTLVEDNTAAAEHGSPAHAGIDLSRSRPGQRHRRLPRARGDRPERVDTDCWLCKAPPRTRGSTRTYGRKATPEMGSPAHAGIDPSSA